MYSENLYSLISQICHKLYFYRYKYVSKILYHFPIKICLQASKLPHK